MKKKTVGDLNVEMQAIWSTIQDLFGKPEPDDDEVAQMIAENKPKTLKEFLMSANDIEGIISIVGEFRGAIFYFNRGPKMEIVLDTTLATITGYVEYVGEGVEIYLYPEICDGIQAIGEQLFEDVSL